MKTMLEIDTGDPNPAERSAAAFIDKYKADAERRLVILRAMSEHWWCESVAFFDVMRSRAWIFTRRITHSAHHRGQLTVYLRLLGQKVPPVYGPSADDQRFL